MAIDKVLNGTPRGFVFLAQMLKQLKRGAELLMKLSRRIPHYWEPTALLRAIRRESRNNHMSPGFHRLHDLMNIRRTGNWVC